MRKVINVTAKDIAKGKPNVPTCCPIALAAKRTFGRCISVGQLYMGIFDGTHYGRTKLPPEAHKFVTRFDAHLSVEPFKFTVEF